MTVTETVTVTENRKTYPQKWTAYNASQTNEKDKFLMLLHDLCSRVNELPLPKTGRRPMPISDALFAICFKIYSTFSGRRFMSDLRDAQIKNYISKTPHFNSIFNYLENPDLTPILHALIVESSLPLIPTVGSLGVVHGQIVAVAGVLRPEVEGAGTGRSGC